VILAQMGFAQLQGTFVQRPGGAGFASTKQILGGMVE
jgi:hypothetical protein